MINEVMGAHVSINQCHCFAIVQNMVTYIRTKCMIYRSFSNLGLHHQQNYQKPRKLHMLVEKRILFLELVTFRGDIYQGLTHECDVLIYYHTKTVRIYLY